MTKFRKTASAALAIAVLATSGIAATTASSNAAPTLRVAPVESSTNTTQAGYHGSYYGGYNNYYQPHCFWKKKRFWGGYGYYWKRVRICY